MEPPPPQKKRRPRPRPWIIAALLVLAVALMLIPVRAFRRAADLDPVPQVMRVSPDTSSNVLPDTAPTEIRARGSVIAVPGPQYDAGPVQRFLLGSEYREIWTTPIEFPILDLARTAGGLQAFELGGGNQTTSLHLWGADGHEYVLRLLDKNATKTLPAWLKDTFVAGLAEDQISSLNPFAPMSLTPLARAVGILHTAPVLVYVPDDPRLGQWRDLFAGRLALFERKPDENQSDTARFGYAKNVIGTEKLLEELREDNDNRVDQRAYLRARLFDMLVGDWDRHADQWRWAEFVTPDGKRYVPVPRDRDYAFAKFDGLLHQLARQTGLMGARRLQNFDEDISDVEALNWQARALDNRFTSELTREAWLEIADSLQRALTDRVIASAIQTWPVPVYKEIGPWTSATLESRRDQLVEAAEAYYEIVSQAVSIVGSNQAERFEVTRLNENIVQVIIYELNEADGLSEVVYRRTLTTAETEEIRLFGLGGQNQYVVPDVTKQIMHITIIDGVDNGMQVE